MTVDLRQFRYLVGVAEELGFSRTALTEPGRIFLDRIWGRNAALS